MEYREYMMENLEKSPGMSLDRPGITTKGLPLEGSFHVLERERREPLVDVCGLVGKGERDTPYKSKSGRPHLSAQVRTVRDLTADLPPL